MSRTLAEKLSVVRTYRKQFLGFSTASNTVVIVYTCNESEVVVQIDARPRVMFSTVCDNASGLPDVLASMVYPCLVQHRLDVHVFDTQRA